LTLPVRWAVSSLFREKSEVAMNHRRAIRILMLSPIYFRLSLAQRRELVKEYCRLFSNSTAARSGK